MANRKEERERLREARLEREQQEKKGDRTRLLLGYGVAGLLGLLVVGGIIVALVSGGGDGGSGGAHIDQASGSTNGVAPDDRSGPEPAAVKTTNLQQAAKQAGCVVRLKLEDEGHNHMEPGSEPPKYKTNPPTSGNHVASPYQQADGAYSETPGLIEMVHSLEHGRMQIQYSPDLPEADQEELKGLYDTMYAGTLLFPNGEMPYEVAATTWTNMLGCEQYKGAATLDAIRAFGQKTWGRFGGEGVGPIVGPTPVEPSL